MTCLRLLPVVLGLALTGALAACTGSGPDAGPVEPVEPVAASPSPSATPASSVPAAPVLVLRADGLALVADGDTTALPFGSGTSVVVPALAATLGEPAQQVVSCGQGERTDLGVDGFDVLFDGDRLVGWDESGGRTRDPLATSDGLTLGSTRDDVAARVDGASFTTATPGPEFSSPGGLGGFLDDAGRVVGLTGGESCVVR